MDLTNVQKSNTKRLNPKLTKSFSCGKMNGIRFEKH